jgi:hypothetical protein
MSVWEATTYKLDVAKSIHEKLPKFAKTILGEKVTDYLKPKGEESEVTSETTWDELAEICNWNIEVMDEHVELDVGQLIGKVKSWSIGTSAIYKLIEACYKNKFEVKDQYPYEDLRRKVEAIGHIVCASSMITPSAFLAVWKQSDENLDIIAKKFENFSEGWKYLTRFMPKDDTEFDLFDQERFFGVGNRIYYGGHIGTLVIMVGSGEYTERGLAFTRTHMNLLIEASARISCLVDHVSREHAGDRLVRTRTMNMLHMTIIDASRAKKFQADKVVQAYHKARSYMQMVLFSNVMENSTEEALCEFQKKNLQCIMELREYVKCFDNVPKARWLEILHVYKWMPPPDYDATYAFKELEEYHNSTRISGLDPIATKKMKKLWKLVEIERRLNLACAFRKMYRDWPSTLEILDGAPTKASLETWDYKALFPYYTYGKDVTKQVKDKTTVLGRMRDELDDHKLPRDRNFLLWYLNHKEEIDTVQAGKQLMSKTLAEDNYVRVAYKGEAHKPGSRLFFMAPPIQRILLGELEGNLARIAHVYPASLQGMSALDRAEALTKVFDVYDTSYVPESGELYTCYVVTFDLSKFSPRFNPRVLENLHMFWAEVFSYKPIESMKSIGADSTILHTTNGLVMSYQNKGADLEGFRGRMMTLFHADLISAACRLSLERGHTIGNAKTAVFIDDGAVRIAARGHGAIAKKNALAFLECMREVYEAAGQENHPNKTIVSLTGGELLAEQYLHGQRLKCPIKAGMRLYPSYENPAACITEEFDSLFSTIQGSIKDGCLWVVAYRRFTDAFVKTIARWDRVCIKNMDQLQFAFKVVTPKSFSGFGLPSLHALASTTAYDLTSEGLGILNAVGRVVPTYRPIVHAIIKRGVVVREPLHILRDPSRIRVEGPILIEGRLIERIIQELAKMTGPCADLVKAYRSPEIIAHATEVAKSLLGRESVSIPVMKRAWDSTPLAYLESIIQKFKRSASIKLVIGEHGITVIRRANKRDVQRVLKHRFL